MAVIVIVVGLALALGLAAVFVRGRMQVLLAALSVAVAVGSAVSQQEWRLAATIGVPAALFLAVILARRDKRH